MRPRFQWDIGRRTLPLGERTLIMGVLNVTPDSFSDGGRYLNPQGAIDHGLELLEEGADLIDIGGESTRPGVPTASNLAPGFAGAVSAEEELERVLPVILGIRKQRPDCILSIDTYKSVVARRALDAGAEIINDVSGFTWDTAMPRTIAERPCGAILMHVRGFPHEWRALPPVPDIVSLVREELRARVSDALDARIARASIVIDPGFGFGKNFNDNYPLLARFSYFHSLGFPLMAAVSRKSFLGHTVSERLSRLAQSDLPHYLHPTPASLLHQATHHLAHDGSFIPPPLPLPVQVSPTARDAATLAASVAAALAGAHIVRVHAVRPAVEALAIADAILNAE